MGIKACVEALKAGKMIILIDNPDRENEGDLVMPAQAVTPEAINFMLTHARGLLCLPMSAEKCDALDLPLMVETQNNHSYFSTPFTLSIGATRGITTGISVQDRAHTILTAAHPQAQPSDLVRPGHIFPLRAHPLGLRARCGHTEGCVELMYRAGWEPCAVLMEMLNSEGEVASRAYLEDFARTHGIPIGTIAELVATI